MKSNYINILNNFKEKALEDKKMIGKIKKDSLCNFLKDFTLHDSYLVGVLNDEDNYFTLCVKWDTYWNKDKLLIKSETEVDLWPILYISFPDIFKVTWRMYQGDCTDTILEVNSIKLSSDDLQLEIGKAGNYIQGKIDSIVKTSLKCVYGDLEIIHTEEVEFICLESNGDIPSFMF